MGRESIYRIIVGIFASVLVFTPIGAKAGPQSSDQKPRIGIPSEPLPHSMAAIGDSISAGALADYNIDSWKNPLEFLSLLDVLLKAYQRERVEEVESRELSWSTGLKKGSIGKSHAFRLKTALSRLGHKGFTAANFSKTGFTSAELLGQPLEDLLSWSARELNQGTPDYVTIFMGSNDVCAPLDESAVSVEDYMANVKTMVSRLRSRNPKVAILMVEVPQIEKLWPALKERPVSNVPYLRSCQQVWTRAGFCDNLLEANADQSRRKHAQLIAQYNQALRSYVASESSSGTRIRLAPEILTQPIVPKNLSIDCFHPSEGGQAGIAEHTWKHSWWPQL